MQVIITNNPEVAVKYPMESQFYEACVGDIFKIVRDAVHKGGRIISHPLSGSIKPNDTPYKSVVIARETGPLDYKSLQIIEDAINVLRRLPVKQRGYDESLLQDFRIIDMDHVKSAIKI